MFSKVVVLGANGYIGWPLSMHLANKGYDVIAVDNHLKNTLWLKTNRKPLISNVLNTRVKVWNKINGCNKIKCEIIDVCDRSLSALIKDEKPEHVIHLAEIPSAPYSMMSLDTCIETHRNNTESTLNLIWACRKHSPNTQIIKFGTMGEYGTPRIDIEEGFLEVQHKGKFDRMVFPKNPGSFYHASKVSDSTYLHFACKNYGLRITDVNQGVVYGCSTEQTEIDPNLKTNFYYDDIWGTAINRFIAQAVLGVPLTGYGLGYQRRGFININDTIRFVELLIEKPADYCAYRVINLFTEIFSIQSLGGLISKTTGGTFDLIKNPRQESENHYYNPVNENMYKLGLNSPRLLTKDLIKEMYSYVKNYKYRIKENYINPSVQWS